MKKIVIGARASNLAQIQANIIKDQLLELNNNIEIEIVPLSTTGDQRMDINWKTSQESLKGLFTTELENSLLDCSIDIAVHSLKDMPTDFHHELCIAGYVNQEDERDALVSFKYDSIANLPKNAIIGTSALRRELQIKDLRDDFDVRVIRGNIETRLKKLENEEYDAIILAAAGLKRANYEHLITHLFNDDEMISSAGQGILCLETRKNDKFILELIEQLKEENTTLKAKVERTFSQVFDGGCTTPMGCNATIFENRIMFKGMYYYEGVRYDGYVEGYTYEQEAIAYRLSNQIKNQYTKNKGKVYLVGSGPGNYELLTIKAQEKIANADCILYDRLISNEVLEKISDNCKLIYVGKDNHSKGLSQSLINEQMINAAFEHQNVVRLKSGDPFIFGRGFEEVQALKKYNIDFEVVPGVSSFIGASSYSGIPLTDRNHSSSIHIFSGHGKNNTDILDYKTIAQLEGTLIFFMSIRNSKEIAQNLVNEGKALNTPVAFVENATTQDQRTIITSFDEILNTDIMERIKSPAIIIVGDVVSLKEKGEWFNMDHKLTLLSTRESKHFNSFEQQASDYNFNSLSAPQIEIAEIINDKLDLDNYDIILFNSVNGVNTFLNQYGTYDFSKKIIGTVGTKTKVALNAHGINIDLMPKVYNMAMLLEETTKQYPSESILIIGSTKTKLDLERWQRRLENKLELCITYDTASLFNDYVNLVEQLNNSNVVCFFSSSGVESFLN
ncbi:MAG: hydroxymethylbilane synthase, partial [Erysipelotrichales bacterium]